MNIHVGNGFCMCGRKIETTGSGMPTNAIYENGECIYAICSHGVAVIDKRKKGTVDKREAVQLTLEDA